MWPKVVRRDSAMRSERGELNPCRKKGFKERTDGAVWDLPHQAQVRGRCLEQS